MEPQQGSHTLVMSPRLRRGCRASWHLVHVISPLHREWLRGMMVRGCGRCDRLCFLCWVTAWAGCLCFWVLGPGLVVPTAERAASGRAVGFGGLWVFVIEAGSVVCLKGMDNFWLFLPRPPSWLPWQQGCREKQLALCCTSECGQDREQEAKGLPD